MKTKGRLTATLLILCLVLPLAGVLLFPAAAAPLTHSLFTDATRDGVDNVAHRDGSDWQIETVDSDGDVGKDTSLVLDARGYPHIAYHDVTNDSLKHAVLSGTTWVSETVEASALDPSLALDGYGNPHIAYTHRGPYVNYAVLSGTTWVTETVDGAAAGPSLALDGSGNPHIAYCDVRSPPPNGPGQGLKYAYWTASGWMIESVDVVECADPSKESTVSLALDAADYPHISYCDASNGDLKYARWDGSAWHIETVHSYGDVGWYSSLALDAVGYPHISYYDASNGDLIYGRWDGWAWQLEAVDTAGDVGQYTSLALDAAGYPHISYRDESHGVLKCVRYDGLAWFVQIVDRGLYVGLHTSLALDGGGVPHISYYDGDNGDLKYARGAEPVIPTTISVYTDKASYSAGETMHLGLDMTTAGPAMPETHQLQSYSLLILLRTPSTLAVAINLTLPFPSGWSYSNPDFLTFPLPALESGTYTWIGELIPVGEAPAVDSAIWTFTSGGASGQRIVPVEKALKQLGEIELNFGK